MAAIVRAASASVRVSLRQTSRRALSTSSLLRKKEGLHVDTPTHTGQRWEEGDYRRMRFLDKEKLVNPNWAVNLIKEDPVVVVKANHVYSNSGGALGHPRVFINLDKPEVAVCGYSGRKFIQAKFYNKEKHGPCITYEEYLKQMQNP